MDEEMELILIGLNAFISAYIKETRPEEKKGAGRTSLFFTVRKVKTLYFQ